MAIDYSKLEFKEFDLSAPEMDIIILRKIVKELNERPNMVSEKIIVEDLHCPECDKLMADETPICVSLGKFNSHMNGLARLIAKWDVKISFLGRSPILNYYLIDEERKIYLGMLRIQEEMERNRMGKYFAGTKNDLKSHEIIMEKQ